MGLYTFIILCACLLGSTVAAASPDPNRENCPQIRPGDVSDNQSRSLLVLVPNITTPLDQQFVNCSDPTNVTGFCIDVFKSALSDLCDGTPPTIKYVCFNFTTKLTYDDMVHVLTYNRSYEAVVGDITIAAKRMAMADFSQPYLQSGIVILTLATKQARYYSALTFFAPFTARMWYTILGAFFFTGFLLLMLEYDSHPEFQEGGLGHRIQSVCEFVGSSLILMQRESIKSPIAQWIMVFWVIFGLLLGSSYTAGLTSNLTAEKLSPKVQDINSLTSSNVPIGYRKGSIVKDYLVNRLQIQETRIKPLRTTNDFIHALSNESVAAVVDEVPYVNMFLSSLPPSQCNYEVVGSMLTTEGFGFAFPLGSTLASQSSKSILNLSESGQLKKLQQKVKLSPFQCSCQLEYTQITLGNSASLYIYLGVLLLACVGIHYAKKRSPRPVKEPDTCPL